MTEKVRYHFHSHQRPRVDVISSLIVMQQVHGISYYPISTLCNHNQSISPAIANAVTMQSAKARCRNMVVVLFFLILCPIRVLIDRVLPIVDMITNPEGKIIYYYPTKYKAKSMCGGELGS